jgi:hypothetical protein
VGLDDCHRVTKVDKLLNAAVAHLSKDPRYDKDRVHLLDRCKVRNTLEVKTSPEPDLTWESFAIAFRKSASTGTTISNNLDRPVLISLVPRSNGTRRDLSLRRKEIPLQIHRMHKPLATKEFTRDFNYAVEAVLL